MKKMDKLLITKNTSLEEIRQAIGKLREQKGKEKETLKLIEEALSFGHDFVANLYLEEALTYQHLNQISEMENAVLKAKKYIDEYNIKGLNHRIFVFLGKVSDSKGQYDEAIICYKKSGKIFESLSHLAYSLIMDGQHTKGYKLAKDVYDKFLNSKEGKELKKKDYDTWIIWMSGLVVRTINALISKKVKFDRVEIEKWLKNTEMYLDKKDIFSYRKAEIKELWTKLQNSKNL